MLILLCYLWVSLVAAEDITTIEGTLPVLAQFNSTGEIRHYAALHRNGGFNYSLLYAANDAPLLLSASVPMLHVAHGSFVSVSGSFRETEKRSTHELPVFEVSSIVCNW
jgi:hypothetical protein